MVKRLAKHFIVASLVFLIAGCIDGLVFPTKGHLGTFYASVMGVPQDRLRPFLTDFVSKIHTHITLAGWVSLALMGIMYFLAPQINEREHYKKQLCYAQFWLWVIGLVVMCAGWHIMGAKGLRAGFEHGTPEFTRQVSSVRPLVWSGGILLFISSLLFAYNIVCCLWPSSRAR